MAVLRVSPAWSEPTNILFIYYNTESSQYHSLSLVETEGLPLVLHDSPLEFVPEFLAFVDGRLDLHAEVYLSGVIEEVLYLWEVWANCYH
jgi:hypothetical protein